MVTVTDESAERLLQRDRNSRREVERAEAFAAEKAQPTSRQIGGPNDYCAPVQETGLTHRYYAGNSYGARAFAGRRGR